MRAKIGTMAEDEKIKSSSLPPGAETHYKRPCTPRSRWLCEKIRLLPFPQVEHWFLQPASKKNEIVNGYTPPLPVGNPQGCIRHARPPSGHPLREAATGHRRLPPRSPWSCSPTTLLTTRSEPTHTVRHVTLQKGEEPRPGADERPCPKHTGAGAPDCDCVASPGALGADDAAPLGGAAHPPSQPPPRPSAPSPRPGPGVVGDPAGLARDDAHWVVVVLEKALEDLDL